jgi:hypothetical protein
MPGDGFGAAGRAAGKQPCDFVRHPGLQLHILGGAALLVPLAPPHPRVLVGEVLLFGVLKCRLRCHRIRRSASSSAE